jgi:hypothetical protein
MVALAGLMGLTSWVVASVATWLVPVYVTAMVLIFVTPRPQRREGRERVGNDREHDAGEDRASGASGPQSPGPDLTGAAILPASGPPEASVSGHDTPVAGSTAAKPRRSRGRARKPARPGAEPAVAPAPATWIRVGPGKFVRADSQDQVFPTAEGSPQDSSETTIPVTVAEPAPANAPVPVAADLPEPGPSPDLPAPAEESVTVADPQPDSPVTAVVPEADEAREESHLVSLPETSEIDQATPDDPLVPEPVVEEYGIAPSALGPDLPVDASEAEIREQDPTGQQVDRDPGAESLAETEIETEDESIPPTTAELSRVEDPGSSPMVSAAGAISTPFEFDPDGESSRRDLSGDRWGWVRIEPGTRPHRVSSGIAGAAVRWLRRDVRPARSRRDFTRLGGAVNLHLRNESRRNLGRFAHVHRGFLPRSPPARS